jgi:hypothetical protein
LSSFFRPLLPLLLTLAPAPALAQPPAVGSVHTFSDPVFGGTVFCDTFDQVRDIAVSEIPGAIYALYRSTPNKSHEPICLAIAPTGLVMEITPVGIMRRDGAHYHAWVVKAEVGGFVAYGLYLEKFEYVSI